MRWIIGDIHGMLRALTCVVEAVQERDEESQFLFAGDYVNRGPDSRGVIEFLLSLPNARFVRGNHDDIFDQVLHGQNYAENATHGDRTLAFQWFMKYGLDSTFLSYGADLAHLQWLAAKPDLKKIQTLADWVPAAHRDFIRHLPPAIEFDDLFIVHGKWGPDEPSESPGVADRLAAQPKLRHALLWGRYTEEEIMRIKAWGRTAYVGHTPVTYYTAFPHRWPGQSAEAGEDEIAPPLPLSGPKLFLLDTAAALSYRGRLTAWCVETQEYVQSTHFGELVS